MIFLVTVYQPSPRYGHCSVSYGKKVIVWGGVQKNSPQLTNHSSPQHVRFTSQVDIFNLSTGKWQNFDAGQGPPHPGFGSYKSAVVRGKTYFFGGTCGYPSCLHAELTEFDNSTLHWERIVANNSLEQPNVKQGHGMVSFQKDDGVDMLCIFGGFIVFSLQKQQRHPYTQNPGYPSLGWTGELHLFNLQTRTWSSPPTTGQCPPPCSDFSFTLVAPQRVLLLGGFQRDRKYVSDIYILDLARMHWSKVNSPGTPWRNGIGYQTVTCIDGPLFGRPHPMVIVMGGKDSNNSTIKGAWLYDIDRNNWMQVPISLQMITRLQYSASLVQFGSEHVRLMLFGGLREWVRGVEVAKQPMIADTVVIELMRGAHGEWLVSGTWDHRALSSREYLERTAERLIQDKNTLQSSLKTSQQQVTELQGAIARFEQQLTDAEEREGRAERRAGTAEQEETNAQQRLDELRRATTECQRLLQQLNANIQQQGEQNNADDELDQWLLQNEDIQFFEGDEFKLGVGGWGEVRVAEYCGLRVAAKKLHPAIQSPHYDELFMREMRIAAKLRHPNLVKFIGATCPVNEDKLIIMELMHSTLRSELERRQNKFSRGQVIALSTDIGLALQYLHNKRPHPVVHRDISSANVLLQPVGNEQWIAKLSDLGSANFMNLLQTEGPGNPVYAAPEANIAREHTTKMDIFSLGVLLIEMQTLTFPNEAERENHINRMYWTDLERLVRDCTSRLKDNRPTIIEVLAQLRVMNN